MQSSDNSPPSDGASPSSDAPGRRVRPKRVHSPAPSGLLGLPENAAPEASESAPQGPTLRPKTGGLALRKMVELKDVLDEALKQPLRKPGPITDSEREALLTEHLSARGHGRRALPPPAPQFGLDLGPYSSVGTESAPLRTLVIGAGQAGLSAAYHLRRHDLWPYNDFLVVDQAHQAGGAWQHRPRDLTYGGIHAIHDLPGLALAEALRPEHLTLSEPIADVMSAYFGAYERRLDLPVLRPFEVVSVEPHPDSALLVVTGRIARGGNEPDETVRVLAASVINATGTWTQPFIPHYPGQDEFAGRQVHSKHLTHPEQFAGQRVGVVGAGFSAIQSLLALHQVGAETVWFTRRAPEVREDSFDTEFGHDVEVRVGEAVSRGELPGSVVSYTKLARTPVYEAAEAAGLLVALPMFTRLDATGVIRGTADTRKDLDALVWCTGYRPAISHLQPLKLRTPQGGLPVTGRLSTQVTGDDRIHLVGYGPSASTSGAARAGRIAARDVSRLFPPQREQ